MSDNTDGNGEQIDFSQICDEQLLDEEREAVEAIKWCEEVPNPELRAYFERQLWGIQAEEKRRDQRNDLPKLPEDCKEIFGQAFERFYRNGEKERRDLEADRKGLNGDDNSFPHYSNNAVRNKKTWAEFVAMDTGTQSYTIKDIAPDEGLAVIHGRGKQGKSTLLIHACRAIAAGQPFLGKETKQKPVSYVNYEMGPAYLKELLEAGALPPNAFLYDHPEPVLTMEFVEALFQDMAGGVIVIDSFRGAFRLQEESENHAGGAGVILRGLQDIALKNKGLVFVVHHRNRGQVKEGADTISGTSDWIAAPDIIWSWYRPESSKPGTLIVEGRMAPIDPLSVELTLQECRFAGTVEETQEKTDRAAIVAAIADEGQTAEVIAEAITMPVGTCRTRLASLYKESLIEREGNGKKGDPYLYRKNNSAQVLFTSAETNKKPPNGPITPLAAKALTLFGAKVVEP